MGFGIWDLGYGMCGVRGVGCGIWGGKKLIEMFMEGKVNDDVPDVVVVHYMYTDHISEEAESPAHVAS